MDFEQNLPAKFSSYFLRKKSFFKESCQHLFIFRKDGVILFGSGEGIEAATVGALMGGVWQAAWALKSMAPGFLQQEGFRLSFDTSSQGIYILPFLLDEREFYMGAIYEHINPAYLKRQLRELIADLTQSLNNNAVADGNNLGISHLDKGTSARKNKEIDKTLFSDISDSEIDALFSFAGN